MKTTTMRIAIISISILTSAAALGRTPQRSLQRRVAEYWSSGIRNWTRRPMQLSPQTNRMLKALTRRSYIQKHMSKSYSDDWNNGMSMALHRGSGKPHSSTMTYVNVQLGSNRNPVFDLVIKTNKQMKVAARRMSRGRTLEILAKKYFLRAPDGKILRQGSINQLYSWANDCSRQLIPNAEASAKQFKSAFGMSPNGFLGLYHSANASAPN